VAYSRANPSPRYLELLQTYRELHRHGDELNDLAPDQTFDGRSLSPHVHLIRMAVQQHGLRSLLDYGCGKAKVHIEGHMTLPDGRKLRGLREIWGVDGIRLFDPGYAPYSELPTGTYDGVICTDVLEHCPEEDIDWIMGELFGFAEKFLFCTIACYPAKKNLPSGENAHITLKNPGWWIDRITAAAAGRKQVKYTTLVALLDKRQIMVKGGGA
jgi:hypothetical protein